MASIPVLKGASRKIPTAERHDLSFYGHCGRHRRVAIRSPWSLRTSPQTGVAIPIAERRNLPPSYVISTRRSARRNPHFPPPKGILRRVAPQNDNGENGFSVPAGRCGHRPLQLKGEKRIPTGINALGMTGEQTEEKAGINYDACLSAYLGSIGDSSAGTTEPSPCPSLPSADDMHKADTVKMSAFIMLLLSYAEQRAAHSPLRIPPSTHQTHLPLPSQA